LVRRAIQIRGRRGFVRGLSQPWHDINNTPAGKVGAILPDRPGKNNKLGLLNTPAKRKERRKFML